MGMWEVKVFHFDKVGDDESIAIAFKMADTDAEKGCLPKAFERAVNAVKNGIEIEEMKKYARK